MSDDVNRPADTTTESAGDLLARLGTDAAVWAAEFRALHPSLPDEGTMIGWFANAIEAGRTAGAQQRCPHLFKDLFISGDLVLCRLCGKALFRGPPPSRPSRPSGPPLDQVTPELITTLAYLFDEYGQLGVVRVVQKMQADGIDRSYPAGLTATLTRTDKSPPASHPPREPDRPGPV